MMSLDFGLLQCSLLALTLSFELSLSPFFLTFDALLAIFELVEGSVDFSGSGRSFIGKDFDDLIKFGEVL